MSRLIFVIAADLLQTAINDALAEGLLNHPTPPKGDAQYPVIQYADDTIVVLPACLLQAAKLKQILEDYATSIGLKINFHKSTIFPINTPGDKCNALANLFGCTQATMPFTYLGLPLGTTRPTVLDLTSFVCKAERKITAAMSLMSHAGRLALINSLITSLAIYPMGTLRLPHKIIAQLDKIRRHCLWLKKTADGDKHNSLAAWPMVCRPKSSGGLGILDLRVQNDGLLLKFLHKFFNKLDIPWVQLIWDTYYLDSIPHAAEICGSFWWRDLIHLMPIYRGITKAQVHTGKDILFWKDHWTDGILAETHPRAFSFASQEDISVRAFLGATTLHETFHLPLSVQAHAETRDL